MNVRSMSSLLICLVFVLGSFTAASTIQESTVIAVFEHKPANALPREDPLELMRRNLVSYESATRNAALNGAQLIVFPEYGLFSTAAYISRDALLSYLQAVPTKWIPCQQETIPGSEIFTDLSCIAKTYKITIVTNVGTVIWCSGEPDCPPDGRFQYNTNLVFGNTGALLTQYHKFNLFGERYFDRPPPKTITFTTMFGKVGVGTCFDLLFKEPLINMMENSPVSIVVLPSYWFNRIPFLAMYEIAEAWAVRIKTVLMVANIHSPETAHVGSGIFGPNGVVNYTYHTAAGSEGQLVLARIPTTKSSNSDYGTKDLVDPNVFTVVANPMENECANEFVASTNGDLFHYTELTPGRQLKRDVCHNGLCCRLSYSLVSDGHETGFFALGAFSGLHTENYTLYNEVCAVVRCLDVRSCGDGIAVGGAGLTSLSLTGSFSVGTYQFPTVLADDARLTSNGEWIFHERNGLQSTNLTSKILVFAIYGRNYNLI